MSAADPAASAGLLLEGLRRIAGALDAHGGSGPTAETLTRLAVDVVPGADWAGVSLARARGRVETVGPTADVVVRADELQYETGQGPCLDAIDEEVVWVPDLREDDRWPRWLPLVRDEGVRSMLCVRLRARGRTHGALNLYAGGADAFDEHDRAVALHLAAHAGVALASAEEEAGLRTAMANRTVIGQAEGILMERYGVDGDRAFAILARYSQESNVKLVDVARRVVEHRALDTAQPGAANSSSQAPHT